MSAQAERPTPGSLSVKLCGGSDIPHPAGCDWRRDVLRDPFKFSVVIGVVFAAIVVTGLSIVHRYGPDAVQTRP